MSARQQRGGVLAVQVHPQVLRGITGSVSNLGRYMLMVSAWSTQGTLCTLGSSCLIGIIERHEMNQGLSTRGCLKVL